MALLTFLQQFSTPAIFFEEMGPMFVIHNISIATDYDIIQFGDHATIYPVYLFRTIIIWGNCLNWLEKNILSDLVFVNFLQADLGTHLWPLSEVLNIHDFGLGLHLCPYLDCVSIEGSDETVRMRRLV